MGARRQPRRAPGGSIATSSGRALASALNPVDEGPPGPRSPMPTERSRQATPGADGRSKPADAARGGRKWTLIDKPPLCSESPRDCGGGDRITTWCVLNYMDRTSARDGYTSRMTRNSGRRTELIDKDPSGTRTTFGTRSTADLSRPDRGPTAGATLPRSDPQSSGYTKTLGSRPFGSCRDTSSPLRDRGTTSPIIRRPTRLTAGSKTSGVPERSPPHAAMRVITELVINQHVETSTPGCPEARLRAARQLEREFSTSGANTPNKVQGRPHHVQTPSSAPRTWDPVDGGPLLATVLHHQPD